MTTRMPRSPSDIVARLLADTSPYLSCDECFERLDEYVEKLARSPSDDDPAMRTHLHGCSACAEEADALLELITEINDTH